MKRLCLVALLSVLIFFFFAGFLLAAGKTPAPAKPPVAGKAALPDLVVTQVKLDQQNRIMLEIKNNGPGPIADRPFAQSSVRVIYGSANEEFLLAGTFKGTGRVRARSNPGADCANRPGTRAAQQCSLGRAPKCFQGRLGRAADQLGHA